MLGVYNYTVLLTYFGMLTGFTGITFAIRGASQPALLCLLIAGVCDMFDGKIASTKHDRTDKEKRFGIQIDSLSDLICFGVLPALIVHQTAADSGLVFFICGLYILSALIRLAYFNVDEEERQNRTAEPRSVYLGLPVTTAALIFPLASGLCGVFRVSYGKVAAIIMLTMAVAFIMPVPVKKPAIIGKLGVLVCGGVELLLLFAGADL